MLKSMLEALMYVFVCSASSTARCRLPCRALTLDQLAIVPALPDILVV